MSCSQAKLLPVCANWRLCDEDGKRGSQALKGEEQEQINRRGSTADLGSQDPVTDSREGEKPCLGARAAVKSQQKEQIAQQVFYSCLFQDGLDPAPGGVDKCPFPTFRGLWIHWELSHGLTGMAD